MNKDKINIEDLECKNCKKEDLPPCLCFACNEYLKISKLIDNEGLKDVYVCKECGSSFERKLIASNSFYNILIDILRKFIKLLDKTYIFNDPFTNINNIISTGLCVKCFIGSYQKNISDITLKYLGIKFYLDNQLKGKKDYFKLFELRQTYLLDKLKS